MRNVPALLQAHLDGVSTTTCRLLKIMTNDSPPRVFGLTTLDQDQAYDDGTDSGLVTYSATNGFDPSAMGAQIGNSVDNAEGIALLSEAVPGITEAMVNAGDLDDAQWAVYLINFKDHSQGHVVMGSGDLGEIRTMFAMMWKPELLSYSARLRQPIGSVWSIRCRAIFGTPAASPTGCGVDAEPLWVNATVTSVGAETNRTFDLSDVGASGQPTPYPGRVQWLTGDNAGREYDVESVSGGTVSLTTPTAYPVQPGDTARIRPDCLKRYTQDCIGVWNNGPNFKGEPHIPQGDAAQVQTPNAKKPGHSAFAGGTG